MIIAIRSEMDSRPLLYPMIRVLNNYGNICVISSNKQIMRLIEDEDNGGFRNIRIIYEESGAVDYVYREYGITPEDFTFIILDNMGAMEYDCLVVPVGDIVSEDFQDEIEYLKKDVNVRFIKFGKNVKKEKESKKERPARKDRRSTSSEQSSEVEEEDYDPAEKFKVYTTVDEEYRVSERSYTAKFIEYQAIEDMEAKYVLPNPGPELANAFYDIFKDQLAIDKRTYDKEVKRVDSNVRGAIRRANSGIAETESSTPAPTEEANPRDRRRRR